MRANSLRFFQAMIVTAVLSGCNRVDNTPGNSMKGGEPQYQVIVQDVGDPAGVPDLGFGGDALLDVLGLGGGPWQNLAPKKEGRARTLANDHAGVFATFEQSPTGKVTGFRAQSGSKDKCGDKQAVLPLIDAATIGVNPPLTLKPASRGALRQALVFQGRTSVSTGGISIQTGSDRCIHWIDVRTAAG